MLPPIYVVCKSHFATKHDETLRYAPDDIWRGIAMPSACNDEKRGAPPLILPALVGGS